MLLAVIYGAFTLFFTPPKQTAVKKGGQNQKSLNAFIIQVAEKTKTGLSKNQAYVLQKAQAAWKRDPLIKIAARKPEKKDRRQYDLKSKAKYTGFLQMGDKRLAIINGMEYETGDILEPGGYIIRNIMPNHVVIAARGGNRKSMILPMEEIE